MTVLNLNAKNFMSHLLLKPTFDRFLLIEGEVSTSNTFRVDGHIHKEFFDDPPEGDYSLWSSLREFFFLLIRGKRPPVGFRFILSLSPEDFDDFLSARELTALRPADIRGLYLNLRYDSGGLQCVSGTSLNLFTMDRSAEHAWDEYVRDFFLRHEIDFEEPA